MCFLSPPCDKLSRTPRTDTSQHSEHLSTSASAATRYFGPALRFIYKLSVAFTAVVKGQVFPPFPYLQNCPGLFWGTALLTHPVCNQRCDINPQGQSLKFSKKITCIFHITVILHLCYKTNIYYKHQISGTRIFLGASDILHKGFYQHIALCWCTCHCYTHKKNVFRLYVKILSACAIS